MSHRLMASLGALAVIVAAPLAGQTPVAKSKTWSVPRTPDGQPDLQGIWTNATITPLERPSMFAAKLAVSDEEAAKFEHQNNDTLYVDRRGTTAEADRDHAYNSLFFDRGTELARVDGVKRTSLIIDPPDGRMPPLTPEARQRNAGMMRSFNNYDSVKTRPLSERCIIGFGSTSGPPMMPVLYNNTYQIVQTPDHIMILVEMVHDARVIRLNSPHAPASVRQWFGDSIGHWEGDTLVVDTTNFSDRTRFRGSSENLHVVERFTRIDVGTILYRVTIEDPTTFARAWTMEFPFLTTKGPVYEYACHEGNYAMTDILGGARKAEQEQQHK